MSGALVTIASFLVTVALLVVVHEWGHYIVARLAGVKILRFSVGFGRPLVDAPQRAGPHGMGDRGLSPRRLREDARLPGGGGRGSAERARAFDRQPVAKRIAIVLAGPAANFLAAFLLYWALYVTGLPGVKPVVGDPPARERGGGRRGSRTATRSGPSAAKPTATWTDVRWLLLKEAVRGGDDRARGGARGRDAQHALARPLRGSRRRTSTAISCRSWA